MHEGATPHAVAMLPPGVDYHGTRSTTPDVVRRSRSGVPERIVKIAPKAPRRGRRFQIVDGGPYYTSYPISYYPHYLILLPTYFMAGLQNNRGRKRRARARPQMTKFGR